MFELLEHTADIGFRARGGTLAELFANSALALESIAVEMDDVRETREYALAASGAEYESLLVNWLNEVLYHLDGERVVFGRFEFDELGPQRVTARGWGETRDPERHAPKLVVKGVTYHQLEVRRQAGGWFARVILDI